MTNTSTLRTPLNPAPRARALATVFAVVLVATTAAHAARDRAPRCGGGFYLVQGQPLVASGVASDALVVGTAGASTLSGCPNAPAQARAGKRGDRLVVRWPACGDVRRVTLRASVGSDCRSVSGTIKAKGKPRRRFTAHAGMPGNVAELMPLPDGAEVVDPATFVELSRQPGFQPLTPHDRADEEASAAAADAANRAVIEEFVAAHPERADLVSPGVDPNDPDVAPTGDGNYALTVRDAQGNASTVVTMGPRYERAVLAETIRRFPTRENQLAIYAQRYDLANATLGLELPTPEEAAALPDDDVTALNAEVAARYPLAEAGAPAPGETAPAWYPGQCRLEIGAGDGTDGSGMCEHSRNGLWKTASWPLKYYDTCAKNQGQERGTCAAFAITAGRELQVAHKYGRWVNLSEQHLYSAAKTTYQPNTFGDGLNSVDLLQQLFDARYEQPLEERWDYNQSDNRITFEDTRTYRDSCVGYTAAESAYCSDTAGQSRYVCAQIGSLFACGRVGAPADGVTVRSTSQPAELWHPGNPDQSFGNLYYAFLANRPVVLGLYVTTSFDDPNPDGFVEYDPETAKWCPYESDGTSCRQRSDCQCTSGNHAVLAVGYVKNEDLPESTPKGIGGGYVVVKNSWGCKGDGGYYYLPVNWVKRFVQSARALGDVETSAPLPDQPVEDLRFNFEPVPPAIHVVQPIGQAYVVGQQVPLVVDGADFQFDGYALNGETRWSSNIQGLVGTGTSTYATLAEGRHELTVTYTGKTGAVATARTTVRIGPRPANVPPTAYFTDLVLTRNQCPVYCPGACVLAKGYGTDPEDGLLSSDASVSWSTEWPNETLVPSGTGASVGNEPKYLGCIAGCGGLYTFTLEVQDSAGQRAFARREVFTPACVN